MKTNPYFNFDGTAEEAFEFYKKVFQSPHDIFKMKITEAPGTEDLPVEEKARMMHVSLQITEHCTLMGSDIFPSMGQNVVNGNECHISIHPTSRKEADRLFEALSADGHVEMPIEDQFWGDYFGNCKDKYGINWMINYNKDF